jgi:hypothetical protein
LIDELLNVELFRREY